jgi:hypothetical protein
MKRVRTLSIVAAAALGLASASGCRGDSGAEPSVEYTFDHDTEGWLLNDRQDSSDTNLGAVVPDGGSPSTLTFAESDGDPSPGSLSLRATFTAQRQFVEARVVFEKPRDLSGKTLHARVRLVSGPAAGLVAGLYVCSDAPPCAWGGGIGVEQLAGGAWVPWSLDVTVPIPPIGYLPAPTYFSAARIVEVGIEVWSQTEVKGELVFEIDTVTESDTDTDGGASGPDSQSGS